MDAAYDMVRDPRPGGPFCDKNDGPEALPCPAGEPPAVEAQWRALAATCTGMSAGDVVLMLELARCLADLEEARRQVTEGGAFVMTKSGDLTENPWAERERKLRAQSVQLRKSILCLGKSVVGSDFAAASAAKAKAEAEAAAKAEEAAKRAEARARAAEKRRAKREGARLRGEEG